MNADGLLWECEKAIQRLEDAEGVGCLPSDPGYWQKVRELSDRLASLCDPDWPEGVDDEDLIVEPLSKFWREYLAPILGE